jgi:hypothetical protein
LSLKKETQMPNDNFSIIGVAKRRNAEIQDATRSPSDYDQDLIKLCKRFDPNEFMERATKAAKYVIAEREKQEKLRQEQNTRNQEIRTSQNQPLEKFAKVFRNRNGDTDSLCRFLTAQNVDTLQNIATEIQRDTRHYASIFSYEVPAALQIVKSEIAARPPETEPSLLTKIKGKIGA